MKAKLTLGALVLAALSGALWLLLGSGDGRPDAIAAGPAAGVPGIEPASAPELAAAAPRLDGVERSAAAERAPAVEATGAAAHPWSGDLAGITGRLVEVDGTPVANLGVTFLQFDASFLVAGDLTRLGEALPSLGLDETRSGKDGRFRLDGAWGGSFHALGVDLGGSRSTFRILDHALHHGERTDVGDIVLDASAVVTGRVIDEAGEPVAGARVRLAPLPGEAVEAGIYDVRPDSLLAFGEETVLEIPAWVRGWVDALPVPTAYSGADGTFRVDGVPLTRVVGGVDKRGWVGIPIAELDVEGGSHDLGDLVMSRGRTARGIVVDPAGAPVPGVEVWVGPARGPLTVLQPCGRSDAEGRFAVGALPKAGKLGACARRTPYEERPLQLSEGDDELRIQVAAAALLTVHVRTPADEPLHGARLELSPRGGEREMGLFAILASRYSSPPPLPAFREMEPGTFVSPELALGDYELVVRAAGCAPRTRPVELRAGGAEVTLTCGDGRRVELTVVDALTREPVEDARAVVMHATQPLVTALAVAWTDASGKASLGPISVPEAAEGEGAAAFIGVQHPRYANHTLPMAGVGSTLEVALRAGGELVGSIHWGGRTPTRSYFIGLNQRDKDGVEELLNLPLFGHSDDEGAFRFSNLPEGRYRLDVNELFLDADPLQLMRDDPNPMRVHGEEVQILAGQTTRVAVDLSPTGVGPTGRVFGTVRVTGVPLAGARVRVSGNQSVDLATDEWGRFDSGQVSVLRRVHVRIAGELELSGRGAREVELYSENLELAAGAAHEIDLDFQPCELSLGVFAAADGGGIAGANVVAQLEGGAKGVRPSEVKTDAGGEATLLLLGAGEHTVRVSHPQFASASRKVSVVAGEGLEPLRFELAPGVPCAGRVIADRGESGRRTWSYVHVQSEDGRYNQGTGLKGDMLEFQLAGLGPGRYKARLWIDGEQGQEVAFELGLAGDRDLVLVFVPQAQ